MKFKSKLDMYPKGGKFRSERLW